MPRDLLSRAARLAAASCACFILAAAPARPAQVPAHQVVAIDGFDIDVICESCTQGRPLLGLTGFSDGYRGGDGTPVALDADRATAYDKQGPPRKERRLLERLVLDLVLESPFDIAQTGAFLDTPDKTEGFGGDTERFSTGVGFFAVKYANRLSYLYAPAATDIVFIKYRGRGGLSHVTRFGGEIEASEFFDVSEPPTGEVPLPAALPLLGAGLLSLGVLARRRRAAPPLASPRPPA